LRRPVGLRHRIDAVIQIGRVAREKELRQESRVERVVAKARRVTRASRDLGLRAVGLRHADRVLKRERLWTRLREQRGRQAHSERKGKTHAAPSDFEKVEWHERVQARRAHS